MVVIVVGVVNVDVVVVATAVCGAIVGGDQCAGI